MSLRGNFLGEEPLMYINRAVHRNVDADIGEL